MTGGFSLVSIESRDECNVVTNPECDTVFLQPLALTTLQDAIMKYIALIQPMDQQMGFDSAPFSISIPFRK